MADAELRQLKIKTGSLSRLTKELVLYEKEHKQEQGRVAAMKSNRADAHDIKHAVRSTRIPNNLMLCGLPEILSGNTVAVMQENVLSEAGMMIPDTRSRVEAALQDLTACMVRSVCKLFHAQASHDLMWLALSCSIPHLMHFFLLRT